MSIKGFLKSAAAGGFGLWLLIEEVPVVKRVVGAITGFDFIYEKANNPSWMGRC